jgi:hypothetical protein
MGLNLPNIRDDELATVQAELAAPQYKGLEPAAIVKQLLAQELVDRAPPKVLQPLTLAALAAALSADGQAWLAALPPSDLAAILDRLRINDRAGLVDLFRFRKGDADAVASFVAVEIDDPAAPTKVLGKSRLSTLLGREVGGLSEKEIVLIQKADAAAIADVATTDAVLAADQLKTEN